MPTASRALMIAAAAWGMAAAVPIAATAPPTSFFEIEHVVGEDGIQEAEQSLVERSAGRGVAIDRARAGLEAAGAWYVRTTKAGTIEYMYAEPETFVTVTLRLDGGVVASAKVTREALGG